MCFRNDVAPRVQYIKEFAEILILVAAYLRTAILQLRLCQSLIAFMKNTTPIKRRNACRMKPTYFVEFIRSILTVNMKG